MRKRREMLSVAVLCSGSSGNSIYLESEKAKVLIDAGVSARVIDERLRKVGRSLGDVEAVFLTHEHYDHVGGVKSLSRDLSIPVYTNLKLPSGIVDLRRVRRFTTGESFSFEDLAITPFPVPHDANDPVGFVIEDGSGRIGLATDLGSVTKLVIERLKGINLLIIETNHDEEMLKNGPYFWELKERIASQEGHLSNRQAGEAVAELLHRSLRHIFLAHLSRENKLPSLAYSTLSAYLNGAEVELHLTFADRPSDFVSI